VCVLCGGVCVVVVVGNLGGRVRIGSEGIEGPSHARAEGKCPILWFPFETLVAIMCVYVC
jgi:hypothetical protein